MKRGSDFMNKVITYPIPEGAVLQNDFHVKVRAVGTEEWQDKIGRAHV